MYGDPQVHPQPESYWGNVNPIGPRACYDEGKRVAETMMYAYANQGKLRRRLRTPKRGIDRCHVFIDDVSMHAIYI